MRTGFPEIDTDPHPIFRVYSAGNLGEVAPQRLSPMSWSLVGTTMERGSRALVREAWGTVPWGQGSHYVFLGYFACRPYHNLSAYTYLAHQLPQVTPEDVSAAYFEGVEPPVVDVPGRESVLRRYSALPRMARLWAKLGPRINRLEEEVTVLEDLARRAIARRSEAGMYEVLLRAAPLLADGWGAHMVTTTGLVPLAVLQRKLHKRLVADAYGVESWLNRPRELVWGRLQDLTGEPGELSPGEFLGTSFYEVAEDHQPWQRFVVRHRAPAAGLDRTDGVIGPDEALWGMLSPARRRLVQSTARMVGEMMAAREHSKSVVMRLLHVHRRLLPVLSAAWGVPADAWPYLTIEEFRRVHREPALLALVGPRREECARAVDLPMPENLDLSGAAAAPWDAQARRPARGVSPGRVTGVVITAETEDPPEDTPCILVCESADADVAPMLGLVDGVLTERGSEMSHIAILAREYRIPAVVGYAGATALRPGDLITIDGGRGEVHVEPAH